MDCRDVERLSSLYWTNELDTQSLLEFEFHMRSCCACRAEMDAQRGYDALLRDAVLQDSAEAAGLQARIRHQLSHPPVFAGMLAGTGRKLVALAATLLVIAGSWAAYVSFRSPQHPASLIADAADDHSDEVIHRAPRRWVYRPSEIDDLMQRNVGDVKLVSELAPVGYHIDRAKICDLVDRSYIHLVYTDGNNEVTVFVRRNTGERIAGERVANVGGAEIYSGSEADVQVSGFEAKGLTVLVVDDLPRSRVISIAEHAAAGV